MQVLAVVLAAWAWLTGVLMLSQWGDFALAREHAMAQPKLGDVALWMIARAQRTLAGRPGVEGARDTAAAVAGMATWPAGGTCAVPAAPLNSPRQTAWAELRAGRHAVAHSAPVAGAAGIA